MMSALLMQYSLVLVRTSNKNKRFVATMSSKAKGNNSIKKINGLIANPFVKREEKNLVALLLLTRTNSQCINSVLNRELFTYCTKLVKTNRTCFLRLVSTLVVELQNKDGLDWTLMTESFFGVIKSQKTVDKNVFEAIAHCCIMDEYFKIENSHLNILWDLFQQHEKDCSLEKSKEISQNHWMLLEEIIEHMLDKNRNEDDCTELMLCLLHSYGPSLCSKSKLPPLWFEKVVNFVVSMDVNTTEASKVSWQDLVFSCAKSLRCSSESIKQIELSCSKGLCDLITANLGCPTSMLKRQVWQACAILVTSFGWSWTEFNNKPKLSSHLCIWTRLAVGEYKLQLEHASMLKSLLYDEIILEACGHVIMASIGEMIAEADSREEGKKCFTPEMLLHLRQSFLECMRLTIEFICSEIPRPPNTSVTKVLASFLSEFSIWDDLSESVKCEKVLFSVNKTLESKNLEMMPALAMIFVSAEESSERVQNIRTAGLFGDQLLIYFESFFSRAVYSHPEYIEFACVALTSYFTLANYPKEHGVTLKNSILLWIEKRLQTDFQNCKGCHLRCALDCYMFLTGDDILPQHALSITKEAMHRASISQAE